MKKTIAASTIAFALAFGLGAQDTEKTQGQHRIIIGLHTSLGFPQEKDVWDNVGAGRGYCLFAEVEIAPHVALRGAGEYTKFHGVDWGYGLKTSAKSLEFRCDLVFRGESIIKGGFFFAGLGSVNLTSEAKLNKFTVSEDAGGLSLSFGVGWDFFGGGCGIEMRYAKASGIKFESAFQAESYSCVQLNARMRFPAIGH